ncbi:hypothetical protein NDU88_005769 [Pleurodeles waltl]|uniref:Uncharacterized protein n=1 Tax=Pleurodeles waltl TaxID=8319 RepID=A0AAV7NNR4_PLEWA|nr:hypothetical protein NDU88_005769 [Pleurodeles waltl]
MSLTGSPDHEPSTTSALLGDPVGGEMPPLDQNGDSRWFAVVSSRPKRWSVRPLPFKLAVRRGVRNPAFLQKADIMVLGGQEGQRANSPNLVLPAPDV